MGISPGDEIFPVGLEHEPDAPGGPLFDAPGGPMFSGEHGQPEEASVTGMEGPEVPGNTELGEPRFGEHHWEKAPVYDDDGNPIGTKDVEIDY